MAPLQEETARPGLTAIKPSAARRRTAVTLPRKDLRRQTGVADD
jgi:hypothetical protein